MNTSKLKLAAPLMFCGCLGIALAGTAAGNGGANVDAAHSPKV